MTNNLKAKSAISAQPDSFFHKGSDFGPGLVSSPDEKKVLSCQYKNKCVTSSEKVSKSTPKTHGGKPVDNSPTSVIACHNKAWTIKLWKKDHPAEQINTTFKCGTWRHEGPCREFKGAQDFSRIKNALAKYDGWVYMVLTWPTRKGNVQNVYADIAKCFKSFRRWIKRNYTSPGEPLQYITLVEQHKDGFPHVNILMHSKSFLEKAEESWKKLRRIVRQHAMSTGWGKVFWLEPMRNKEAMAGYFVKLCGEVAKTSQAPMAAPKNFRRLRSSQGLLEPINKDTDFTGELVMIERHLAKKRSPRRLLEQQVEQARIDATRERRAMFMYESLESQADFLKNAPSRERLELDARARKFQGPDPGSNHTELHPLAYIPPKIQKSA